MSRNSAQDSFLRGAGKNVEDRLQRLEEELKALKEYVLELSEKVQELRADQNLHKHPVETILNQRGFPIFQHGAYSQLLLAPTASPEHRERFFQLMRRYSFRLFLRDLIHHPRAENLKELSRYCSLKTVRAYMKDLAWMGIVELSPNRGYRLVPEQVPSFGPTLEWYICEILKREFLAPAMFNVRLKNTLFGGDYDVISIVAGHLTYIEVKSSPPRGVELEAVSAFLNRVLDLQPGIAIFFVDTELRMKDKIAPLFIESLEQLGKNQRDWAVERLVNEIFHIRHGIYLINSQKGVYSNLRICFRDFLHQERRSGPPADSLSPAQKDGKGSNSGGHRAIMRTQHISSTDT
jgi:hypothetical protein